MQRIREAWKQSEKEAAQWRAQAQSEKNDQSTDCDGLNDSDAETQLRARAEAAERDLALWRTNDVKLQDARRGCSRSWHWSRQHSVIEQHKFIPCKTRCSRPVRSHAKGLIFLPAATIQAVSGGGVAGDEHRAGPCAGRAIEANESKLEAERKTKELEIARLRLHTRRFTLSRSIWVRKTRILSTPRERGRRENKGCRGKG